MPHKTVTTLQCAESDWDWRQARSQWTQRRLKTHVSMCSPQAPQERSVFSPSFVVIIFIEGDDVVRCQRALVCCSTFQEHNYRGRPPNQRVRCSLFYFLHPTFPLKIGIIFFWCFTEEESSDEESGEGVYNFWFTRLIFCIYLRIL